MPPGRADWFYRLGAGAAMFLGPLIRGVIREANTGAFVAPSGLCAVVIGVVLLRRPAH